MLTREQIAAYEQHRARVTPCAQVASDIVARANARAEKYAADRATESRLVEDLARKCEQIAKHLYETAGHFDSSPVSGNSLSRGLQKAREALRDLQAAANMLR